MALPPPGPETTVLVTGASSGIGAELARELARRGHHVTIVARRQDRLRRLAAELGNAEVGVCDLADARARADLIGAIERSVIGVCNNAGYGTSGAFARLDLGRETEMIRVNAEALHELTGAFLPGMLERGAGAVLNVASIAGMQPLPGLATYAATKAFAVAFSEALHAELVGTGVSCTVLCPGPTATEFSPVAGLGDLERRAPSFLYASPRAVAQAGVRGMLAGKRTVIPGASNRALASGGRLAPRAALLPAVKAVTLGPLRPRE